ncbi:hypothetical protein Q3G72_008382 [Acer saccharum]|nr:hypothetical protein Q3G72_008382 [Acer saccharum]
MRGVNWGGPFGTPPVLCCAGKSMARGACYMGPRYLARYGYDTHDKQIAVKNVAVVVAVGTVVYQNGGELKPSDVGASDDLMIKGPTYNSSKQK